MVKILSHPEVETTTPTIIANTCIQIPELVIEKKRIGKNTILQMAQKEDMRDVSVYSSEYKTFLLKSSDGKTLFIKLKGSKFNDPSKDTLVAKELKDIADLKGTTKLSWQYHHMKNSPTNPELIIQSWKNSFYFKGADGDEPGLRPPQLAAIHAIASKISTNKCMTVVMPTGTGKTEVMISTLVYNKCPKVLVLVPSTVLRKQTLAKFSTLGCLREIGVVDGKAYNPRVSVIESGMQNMNDVEALLSGSNVIIALTQSLKNFSDETLNKLISSCTHLFIDEAHHVPAQTWNKIKESFKNKPILQFTATPFRRDGKRIDGEIIYNYPLGLAQQDGYFKKINLIKIQEFDSRKEDEKIAISALQALKTDLNNGLNHLLMARCEDKKRALETVKIYQKLAPEYNPEVITSEIPKGKLKEKLDQIKNGTTKVIVCVDMLGEGYDLPALKVAALHDPHKSLAITLQFIGRFTRTARNVGDATVVINTADPQVGLELENLYADDTADWNSLLKEKSESTIQKELELHEFINNFSGELSSHISLWNLRPSFSTIVFQTSCNVWHPKKFEEVLPKQYKRWYAINEKESILVIVISKDDDVTWGRYKDIKNHSFELCVAHWSEKHKALFIQCSDYDAFNCIKLAKVLCGDSTQLKNGQKVFNIFSGVERTLARNVGVKTLGNISFTMHIGVDITTGLSKLEKSQGILNNIYGWGYEDGNRVDLGCSSAKGKIWSRGGGPIILWKHWCHNIADKVFDDSIEESKIINDFLKPQELKERYSAIPINIQWGDGILTSDEDNISVYIGENEYRLYDVNLEIADFTDTGPIKFKVYSDTQESTYEIQYKPGESEHSIVNGSKVKLRRGNGDIIPIEDYVKKDPPTIHYIDGTFSFDRFHVPTPKLNSFFDKSKLTCIDWTGTNIQTESLGKENNQESIQHKMAELIKEDYDVIFNDDASGEAADLIALRIESNDTYKLHLIHCKFSSSSVAGSRISDFYALCGQAQKSIAWKHNGMEHLYHHIKNREETWQQNGYTRFLKGDIADLSKIRKFARAVTKPNFEITIVQPGLSKEKISDDITQLLGCTEDYLIKTSGATFNVYCSK